MDILVVERLADDVVHWLASRHAMRYAPELAGDGPALREALCEARAAIVPASVVLDEETLHEAPLLRAVGRVSGGLENLDLDACTRIGIEVVRSVSAAAQAEAEFMLGALLTLLRRVPVDGPDGLQIGRELGASTVGLIGMTPAVKPLAPWLGALGTEVLGYDPAVHASDPQWRNLGVQACSLADLLRESDAICVQLADFTRYHGLLGERLLLQCKLGQVVLSLSPWRVFDEAVLAQVLASGRVAAAWLDHVDPVALEEGRPLHGLPTLQVTPRLASITHESRLRGAWAVARRIDELLGTGLSSAPGFSPSSPGDLPGPADGPEWP